MTGFTWPQAQVDGRIGAGSPTTSLEPLSWTKATSVVRESQMGKWERVYLAFYDQDKELRDRDGSIWTKVLEGEG